MKATNAPISRLISSPYLNQVPSWAHSPPPFQKAQSQIAAILPNDHGSSISTNSSQHLRSSSQISRHSMGWSHPPEEAGKVRKSRLVLYPDKTNHSFSQDRSINVSSSLDRSFDIEVQKQAASRYLRPIYRNPHQAQAPVAMNMPGIRNPGSIQQPSLHSMSRSPFRNLSANSSHVFVADRLSLTPSPRQTLMNPKQAVHNGIPANSPISYLRGVGCSPLKVIQRKQGYGEIRHNSSISPNTRNLVPSHVPLAKPAQHCSQHMSLRYANQSSGMVIPTPEFRPNVRNNQNVLNVTSSNNLQQKPGQQIPSAMHMKEYPRGNYFKKENIYW